LLVGTSCEMGVSLSRVFLGDSSMCFHLNRFETEVENAFSVLALSNVFWA
jgi:hypothetical protein